MNAACQCCGSANTALLYSGTRSGPIWYCNECGFVFVHPTPDKIYFDQLYSGPPGDVTYRPRQKALFEKYLKWLTEACSLSVSDDKPKLLDIGSGDGYFVEMACEYGFDAYGFDYAAHRLPSQRCCSANALHFPFRDKTFNVCTLWFCLEHFTDPPSVIAECKRVTVLGGGLAISAPYAEALLHNLRRNRWSQYIPGHLGFYTRRSLIRLLGSYGYEIIWFKRTHQTSIAQVLTARGKNVQWFLENPLMRLLMLFQIPNPLTNVITLVAALRQT